MDYPIVTIIIPVFNRAELVSEAINSIILQTNPNWEAILVDDGSTDNTLDVIQQFEKQDKRIRAIKREYGPKGASTCRNLAVEFSTSEYLFFLDSDDLIGNSFIETRFQYIHKYPELDFIVFPEASFTGSNTEHLFYKRKLFDKVPDILRFLKSDNPWMISGPIIKKSSFLKYGGFNELLESGQDWELFVKFLLNDLTYIKIDCFENVDVFIRSSSDITSITNTNTFEKWFISKSLTLDGLTPLLQKQNILDKKSSLRRPFIQYFLKLSIEMAKRNKHASAKLLWRKFYDANFITYFECWIWCLYLGKIGAKVPLVRKGIRFLMIRIFAESNFLS
jgi:glycosyltransferase involved in cell wall biosynthesis